MERRQNREDGFSLLETVVVVAIIAVVTAIAVPNVMTAVYNIRLSSSASSVSTIFMAARQQAVRDNTYYYVCSGTVNSANLLWISGDVNCATPSGTQVQLNQDVQVATTGMPSGLTLTGFTPQAQAIHPAFNSRGVPCVVSGSTCLSNYGSPQTTVGFVIYLQQTRSSGSFWAAVSVSPSGRVERWQYTSSGWQQQ